MPVASASMPDDGIDWAGIETASAIIGIREAARRAAINFPPEQQPAIIERIRKRAQRQGWKVKTDAIINGLSTTIDSESGKVIVKPVSPIVPTGKQMIDDTLATEASETRSFLSKTAHKAAKAASEQDGAQIIATSDKLLNVGKLAALTHGWSNQASAGMQINLLSQVNVTNLSESGEK